eukprot:4956-Heterococcus_DN1.PRE.1
MSASGALQRPPISATKLSKAGPALSATAAVPTTNVLAMHLGHASCIQYTRAALVYGTCDTGCGPCVARVSTQ